MTDLAGSLVTSCRPPGRTQSTPDDRTWNAGVAVRTADGSRWTADAADVAGMGAEYCDSASVCVVVCPSTSKRFSATHVHLHQFLSMFPFAVMAQSYFGGVAMRYVLPVLLRTSRYCIQRVVGLPWNDQQAPRMTRVHITLQLSLVYLGSAT